MSAARYRFTDDWTVPGSPAAVRDLLVDLGDYPRWWPQVRAVASLGSDRARVRCRSALPYTLDLTLRAVSRELPRLEVEVSGDLAGRVSWTLRPAATGTRMLFEQDVMVDGPLALASRVLRPVLRWNHARMMAGCRAGLVRRLSGGSRPASR
ncbi:MAG: SRPBCC family protein [Nocardioides sp.]|uniref:SRPBCC family protein n=1 Tax=Nocardioides sp. TaxID=35761 RepID=UPI0039E217E3